MSQDPALVSLTPEARREAQEKAGKKRIAREIIKLRKRLELGTNHSFDVHHIIDFLTASRSEDAVHEQTDFFFFFCKFLI